MSVQPPADDWGFGDLPPRPQLELLARIEDELRKGIRRSEQGDDTDKDAAVIATGLLYVGSCVLYASRELAAALNPYPKPTGKEA